MGLIEGMKHHVTFLVDGSVQPYTRTVRGQRYSRNAAGRRAAEYHQEKQRVAFLYAQACGLEGKHKALPKGIRIGVAVWKKAVQSKRSDNYGEWPGNGGDWDNYFKLVPDALQPVHLRDDHGGYVRGPERVLVDGRLIPAGCYICGEYGKDSPCMVVTIWTPELQV